ncbi:MAG: WYL domain-containing protein [Lachnospiraceae bacterium]|nr:WYL domain-containing protein [Lachnospiraceae bacterium]
MELFSETYSCYYQVLHHLLYRQTPLTIEDIRQEICREGFEESLISIIPKLENGVWNLFEKDGSIYRSKLNSSFSMPLSDLEKSYLKALLSDPRIGLFLEQKQLESLNKMLASSVPLWKQEHFCYYDRFTDGDPYTDKTYRSNFRTLLLAQKQKRYVDIDYTSPRGTRVHHHYVPARLEYSVKNDKFRLLALKQAGHGRMKLETLNLSRMQRVILTDKFLTSPVDLNTMIQNSYYTDPLRLHIINKRNALERAMLHFANFEKNTTKIDESTYECLIYYNRNMETELLIEVMSFGPMLKVMGNDRFLRSLKARLQSQRDIVSCQQK